MIHLLQLMIHLLDTCPELEVYPTCKSYVATNESSGAADDSSVAINDLSIWTSFWFNPNLTWFRMEEVMIDEDDK
ncbi:hypothetical protein H5410_061661 [Solanum commersonii]|uniref:Late blight resistance protein n=1 Tax=Solanum commersonii TaxID=4109 RepID=A0A9J5W9A0_SOLCO|nr:hypothetical protein H5410_061661 [Solanum commersonii]